MRIRTAAAVIGRRPETIRENEQCSGPTITALMTLFSTATVTAARHVHKQVVIYVT